MAFIDMTGKQVPSVTFHTQQQGKWVDISTDELFKGKKVVLFALPGAFTPTCSSLHLPRYNELATEFAKLGVDDIVCVSVNDTFVMNAWAKDQDCSNVTVIPDGNGEFTEAMGRLIDDSAIGFGKRSWRYSMLVRDGVIEKMFIEPNVPGDPYEVSDGDTMMDYLAPGANKPASVLVFSRDGCPFCARAKGMLADAGMAYDEITVGGDEVTIRGLRAATGRETVPQVFVDGKHIGGSDDLAAWFTAKS